MKKHAYFMNEGGVGIGDKLKVGPVKIEVSLKDTMQNESSDGTSTRAEVRHIGASVEIGQNKFGLAAEQSTVTNRNGKPVDEPGPWEFTPGYERGKVSAQGSQVGLGDTFCVIVCGGYEAGVNLGAK